MPTIPEEADLRIHAERLRMFARAREWEQFHTPKNLAMAIVVEAAELLEPLQWLTPEEAETLKDDAGAQAEIGSEIADVAIYLIRLADVLGVDLGSAIAGKIDRNEERFPVEVVRGKSRMPEVEGGESP